MLTQVSGASERTACRPRTRATPPKRWVWWPAAVLTAARCGAQASDGATAPGASRAGSVHLLKVALRRAEQCEDFARLAEAVSQTLPASYLMHAQRASSKVCFAPDCTSAIYAQGFCKVHRSILRYSFPNGC